MVTVELTQAEIRQIRDALHSARRALANRKSTTPEQMTEIDRLVLKFVALVEQQPRAPQERATNGRFA